MTTREISKATKRYWWFVLVVTLLASGGAYWRANRGTAPSARLPALDHYEAGTKVIVVSAGTTSTSPGDALASQNFAVLARSNRVLEKVSAALPPSLGLTVEVIRKQSTINPYPNSSVIGVFYVSTTPQVAAEVANRITQTTIAEMQTIGNGQNIRVFEEAIPPTTSVPASRQSEVPVQQRATILNVGAAGAAGLFFSVGLAVLLSFALRRVQEPEDLRIIIGAVPVATLGIFTSVHPPETPLAAVVPDAADGMNEVIDRLAWVAPNRPQKVVLVTSAGAGEGKSAVSAALAVLAAHSVNRVLLMDLNLRRPVVFADNGLTSVIRGLTGIRECLVCTDLTRAVFLPAGPIPPFPDEYLRTDRLRQVLSETDADIVILDAGSLADGPEVYDLSALADACVMVAQAGRTSAQTLRDNSRKLTESGARIIAAVLTKRVDNA